MKRKRAYYSLLILLILLILGTARAAAPRKNSTTIFYYLSGDNNLEFMMKGIIGRIEQVGSSQNVVALVQTDGPKLNDSSRFKVLKSEREVYESNVEYDMGNIVTLTDFLDWGMSAYPAEKYVLYIAGHGLGVMGFDSTSTIKNSSNIVALDVGVDWDSKNAITIRELSNSLEEVINTNPFELIVFNSCLMGNLETITGLKNITNYVLASEYEIQLYKPSFASLESTNAIGIDGATLLKVIKDNDQDYTIQIVGEALMDQYRNSYKDGIFDVYLNKKRYLKATLSLYNTKNADRLIELFRLLSTELRELIKNDLSIVDEIYIRTLSIPMIYWFGYLDSLETLKIIADITQVESAQELVLLLESDDFIETEALINVGNVSGLSFFFPRAVLGNPPWNNYLKKYLEQEFSIQTGWGETLGEYAAIWSDRRYHIVKNLLQNYLDGNPRKIVESDDIQESIDYLKDLTFILLYGLKTDDKLEEIRTIVARILPFESDPIIAEILEDIYDYLLKDRR